MVFFTFSNQDKNLIKPIFYFSWHFNKWDDIYLLEYSSSRLGCWGSQVIEWKFGSRDIHSKLYLSYFYSHCQFFAVPFMNKTKTHRGGIISGLILWIGLTHSIGLTQVWTNSMLYNPKASPSKNKHKKVCHFSVQLDCSLVMQAASYIIRAILSAR